MDLREVFEMGFRDGLEKTSGSYVRLDRLWTAAAKGSASARKEFERVLLKRRARRASRALVAEQRRLENLIGTAKERPGTPARRWRLKEAKARRRGEKLRSLPLLKKKQGLPG